MGKSVPDIFHEFYTKRWIRGIHSTNSKVRVNFKCQLVTIQLDKPTRLTVRLLLFGFVKLNKQNNHWDTGNVVFTEHESMLVCALFYFEFRSILGRHSDLLPKTGHYSNQRGRKSWRNVKSLALQGSHILQYPEIKSQQYLFLSFDLIIWKKGGKFDWGTLLSWMSAKKFLHQFKFEK